MPRGLSPLRHRGFRLLASGQLASNLGDAFYAVALPWYVLSDHGGALLLGIVLAAYGIPRTALLAVGGHVSDRVRPWTVMMAADSVRAVAVAALASVAALAPPHAYLLVPIAVVVGAGEGMFVPGSFAIIPALLPDEDLQAGNALSLGSTQLATLVGPVVGGLAVVVLGPWLAFALDAVSFAVSAVTLGGVRAGQRDYSARRAPARERGSEQPTLRGLLARKPALRLMFVTNLAANLGSAGMGRVALPALARGVFHTGAGGYGGLVAAMGGGMLLGTVVAGHVGRLRRPAVIDSLTLLGAAALTAVAPFLGGLIGAGAALTAFGGLVGFGNVIIATAFQRWAPRELMGRLMGLMILSSMGIMPVSVLLAGLVVNGLGAADYFPITAAVLAAAAVASLSQRSWREFGSSDAADAADARSPGATCG